MKRSLWITWNINISHQVYRFVRACPLPKGYEILELEKKYLRLYILYKLRKGFPSPPVTLGFPPGFRRWNNIFEKWRSTCLQFQSRIKKYASPIAAIWNPWDLFFMLIESIHPWILTWNIIMEVWKIIFLSKWAICRFHVNLPGFNYNSPWEPTTFSFRVIPHIHLGPKPFIPHAFVVQRHLVLILYHENRSIKGLPQVDLSPAFGNLKYCWNKTYPCFVKQRKTSTIINNQHISYINQVYL